MKTKLTFIIIILFFQSAFAQNYFINRNELKTIDGFNIPLNKVLNDTVGTIVIFWEMNDDESNKNLENLNEIWQEKIKPYGINLVSICVDKTGTWYSVKPFVAGKDWGSENYIDFNGKFTRSLCISDIPYTILLDGNNEVKCRYSGYCIGNEEELCNKIIKCIEKDKTLAHFK